MCRQKTVAHRTDHELAFRKILCGRTFGLHAERIPHFKERLMQLQLNRSAVIIITNADDYYGSVLADKLLPGFNRQEYHARGETPFARGLAYRTGIEDFLALFDMDAARKLRAATDVIPVVIVDHGVAEVFSV